MILKIAGLWYRIPSFVRSMHLLWWAVFCTTLFLDAWLRPHTDLPSRLLISAAYAALAAPIGKFLIDLDTEGERRVQSG